MIAERAMVMTSTPQTQLRNSDADSGHASRVNPFARLLLGGGVALALWALATLLSSATAAAQQLAGPSVSSSCEDRNGRFDFTLPNESQGPIDYSFTVLDDTRSGTIAPGETEMEVVLGLPDGDYSIPVTYNEQVVGPLEIAVACDVGLPHEVSVDASCLANRGRIDITITNVADVPTTFDIVVGTLMRQITIEADGTGVVTVTGRPNGPLEISLAAPGWTATSGASIACDPVQTASLTGFCAGPVGSLAMQLSNPSANAISYTVELLSDPPLDREPDVVVVESLENASVNFSNLPNGEYLARLTAPGIPVRTFPLRPQYCAAEAPDSAAIATTSCLAGRGRIDVWVRNSSESPLDTTMTVGTLAPRSASIETGRIRPATSVTGRLDGTYNVAVTAAGLDYTTSVEIDCDGMANATMPEVLVSCLADRGRIDVILPNTTDADVLYRVEFPGLAPRELTVSPPSTGRITITGRPDAPYTVVVFADDVQVLSEDISVMCAAVIA